MNPSAVRPLNEQIACVKREIGMRERVYPNFVARGKMKEEKAEDEREAMRSVLDTLEHLASAGEPTQSHLVIIALSRWIQYVELHVPLDENDEANLETLKREATVLGFLWPE